MLAAGSAGSYAAADGGTVTGVVKFGDVVPPREEVSIGKDQATCGTSQVSEQFVFSDENHGLKNVVVSVLGIKEKIKAADKPVAKLVQKGCRYIPHVQALPRGTVLEITNLDPILHNIHAYTTKPRRKTAFNKAQPKSYKMKKHLKKRGTYQFFCDIHDHMSAYIVMMDHPYYAVTDENGAFSITGVPPGTYKVSAWHEALGNFQEKEVQIASGKTADLTFEILPGQ